MSGSAWRDALRRLLAALDDVALTWRSRRCPHPRLVQMFDGPTCLACGRTWLWVQPVPRKGA